MFSEEILNIHYSVYIQNLVCMLVHHCVLGACVCGNFVVFSFVCVQGGTLGRYVQRKLSGLKIFEEPFVSVRENLRMGVAICEQWVVACEHLTGQVWNR